MVKKLKYANISNFKFTSIRRLVQDADNIEYINAEKNQITEVPDLTHLTKLTYLNLSHNKLTCLHPSICTLRECTDIHLSSNDIKHIPDEFGELVKLVTFYMSCNLLTKLPPLNRLVNLENVYLDANCFREVPDTIQYLPNLKNLSLSNNMITEIPDFIGNIKYLHSLHLDCNQITSVPPSIANCRHLKMLYLDNNRIETLPHELYQIKTLYRLNLAHNTLRRLDIPANVQLRDIRILVLSYNHLETLPDEIGQLDSLRDLELDHNEITSLPPSIKYLADLDHLNLSHNSLETLPHEIGTLFDLGTLYLNDNRLTSLPITIGQLEHLSRLYLENNLLTDLPSTITNLEWLYTFNLDGNPLNIYDPAILAFMHQLERDTCYPDGIAFEIHNAFLSVNMEGCMYSIQAAMPDIAPYTFMSNKSIITYIVKRLKEFAGGAGAAEDLDTICTQLIRHIDYSHIFRKLIYYVLEYTSRQPPTFQETYISTFIYDCMHAYAGKNPMSCPRGAMERLITSLIPAMCSNPIYAHIIAHITGTPIITVRKILEEYAGQCYKECGGDAGIFMERMTAILVEKGLHNGTADAELEAFIEELGVF